MIWPLSYLPISRSNYPQKSLIANWFTIKEEPTRDSEKCQLYSYKIFHEINQYDEITDLRQIKDPIPNIDIFLLPIGNPKELTEFLHQKSGLWSWNFQRFWKGFFPILIIEIINEEEDQHQNDNTTDEEYDENIWKKLKILFSFVRKIQIKNRDLSKEKLLEVVTEFVEDCHLQFIQITKP